MYIYVYTFFCCRMSKNYNFYNVLLKSKYFVFISKSSSISIISKSTCNTHILCK